MKCFRKILYVAEPSVAQESAMARAVSLAENNQAELTVVEVLPPLTGGLRMPPGGPVSADLEHMVVGECRKRLELLVEPYRERLDIRVEVLTGKSFLEVIRRVLRDDHDLVLKPAENPDFIERLFGSDDMHLLRKCPCPVWLLKPEESANYQRILAAVDFDPERPESIAEGINATILELAASLAVSDFAELHLVHAWEAPAEGFLTLWTDRPDALETSYLEAERARRESAMDWLRQHLRERLGGDAYGYLAPHFHLLHGRAINRLPELAQELRVDLVVMGTVARAGIPGLFMGNTAEAVLDQLSCSVLAVKPPGFESPVRAQS